MLSNNTKLHKVEVVNEADAEAIFRRSETERIFVQPRHSIIRSMQIGETIRERCVTPEIRKTRQRKLWCRNRGAWAQTARKFGMVVGTICVDGWLYIRREK